MPNLDDYNKLVENRPYKWSAEDVNYREAEGRHRCARCLHFYERRIDHFGVCELFRSDDTDEEGVQPNFTCDWYTTNGKSFPLQANEEDS